MEAPAACFEHCGAGNGRADLEVPGDALDAARQAIRSKHRRSDGGRQRGRSGEAGPRNRIEIGPLFAVDLNRTRVRIGLRHVNAVAVQEVAGENGKIGLAERIAPARRTRATALASSFGI
jgi:hypothetical protein